MGGHTNADSMRADVLYVLLDCSGSMNEMGKLRLARNLLSFIREQLRLGILPIPYSDVRLVLWRHGEARFLDIATGEDIPTFPAEGQTSIGDLLSTLEEICANFNEPLRLLMLSDGGISMTDLDVWKKWREAHSVDMRVVAIGADASVRQLERLCGKENVYCAEDIAIVISEWPHTKIDPVGRPRSISDIAAIVVGPNGVIGIQSP